MIRWIIAPTQVAGTAAHLAAFDCGINPPVLQIPDSRRGLLLL